MSSEGQAYVLHGLASYQAIVTTIARLTDDRVAPKQVQSDIGAVRDLLARHPLISPIELQVAFDLSGEDEVRALLQPLFDAGEARIELVQGGWFIAA